MPRGPKARPFGPVSYAPPHHYPAERVLQLSNLIRE